MKIISPSQLQSTDVVGLSQWFLGKAIFVDSSHGMLGALITETEAYAGIDDRASHAHGNRKTRRTSVMYKPGGRTYVYLCYGIHHLLNFVTGPENEPHAVLIRAVLPFQGISHQIHNRKLSAVNRQSFTGPGKVTQALGLDLTHNDLELNGLPIAVYDVGLVASPENVLQTARIGVDYAGPDAALPYRFIWKPWHPEGSFAGGLPIEAEPLSSRL